MVTKTPEREALPLFMIIIALVSQPPLLLSGVPTKTVFDDPFHGSGFGYRWLSSWCVS
jgi:hypothetical protein